MKKIITILLFSICVTSYSQDLQQRLQGEWVCTEILDASGHPTQGKFGDSNEYLKFVFKQDKLSFVEAPFDLGSEGLPVEFKRDVVQVFPEGGFPLPEKSYKITSQDEKNLILTTKNKEGEQISYHLIKQDEMSIQSITGTPTIDNGLIFVKHIRSRKNSTAANRVGEYRISNSTEYLYARPQYDDAAFGRFCDYFVNNLTLSKDYPLDKESDEIVVDFDVDATGATNVRVVKGDNAELNKKVIETIEKSRKNWNVLKVDGKTVTTTMRFRFVFFVTVSSLL